MTFDFGQSTNADGIISRSEIDIEGDGIYQSFTEGNGTIIVEYGGSGLFTSVVRIVDAFGGFTSTSVVISVFGTAPSASLTLSSTTGFAPLWINLAGTNSQAGMSSSLVLYEFDVDGDPDNTFGWTFDEYTLKNLSSLNNKVYDFSIDIGFGGTLP